MKTRIFASALAGCLLLFLGSPLLGQERHRQHMGQDSARMEKSGMMGHQGMMGGQHGMMGQQGMMGHGHMMGMSPAMMMTRPGALLHMAEPLGLTEDQTARLEEIRSSAHESHQMHMEQAHSMHVEARELLQGDAPDLDAYTETLQSAMSHMAQAHASMARASVEARGVLTDAQKEQLKSAASIMQTMHRMQGMQGGMGGMHKMEMEKDEGGMPHGR